MSIERDRIFSLIEYAQHSARLRSKPTANVAEHNLFSLYEHQIQGLPGIQVNVNDTESDDEIWLAVKRLHEIKPPDITSKVLQPWVEMTQSPYEELKLREAIDGESLIAAGTHCSSASRPVQGKPVIDPNAAVILSNYENAVQVRAQLATYLETKWRPWAEEEKLRRKTIKLYSQLFTLKQQLEGGIVETQLEFVWGVGVSIWNSNGTSVAYPAVGRLVEVSLNPKTAEVEIRPREVDPRLEIAWYASVDNPGVDDLERAAKEFFGKATTIFSPFDRGTFEPLLRIASTNLDANGIYWPNVVPAEDRNLPKPDDKLKITDTWVLFARPRTNSIFLQDLAKLKKHAEEAKAYPPAMMAVVTDPDTTNPVVELPSFRGASASYHTDHSPSGKRARNLYFPKPFNDEQVRIVQLLDMYDGVVVQGPPGTGKTHTIANVICHYLAEGKRVLVTSMKDPALAVLQEHLPAEIRPLAISLLSSEQDGMKRFEYAIEKIASEVQSLDRSSTAKAINHLEESIDALHGKLASIDRKVGNWAKQNLVKITLNNEQIHPQEAAREVVENANQFEWITDALGVTPEFDPQFSDADILQLREARRALGLDIDYLEASLPQLVAFPDSKQLLEVHQDLSQFEKLKKDEEKGDVLALADSSEGTLTLAQELLVHIEKLKKLRVEIVQANQNWTVSIREEIRLPGKDDLLQMLEALGAELVQSVESRKVFLERPVSTPEGIEVDTELMVAVGNLTVGEKPFGLKGIFGKSDQQKQLDSIRDLGRRPAGTDSWKHVSQYLVFLKRLRELALRWNTLAHELHLATVPGDKPEAALVAADNYALYIKVKTAVDVEGKIRTAASHVFPNWLYSSEVADSEQRLSELEKALRHHLTKDRLANAWARKERFQRVLEGRNGRIIDDLRHFLGEILGNATVTDTEMQTKWSAQMAELARLHGLSTHLISVREVCDKVEASGAPIYASALKQPGDGIADKLLPDNWRKAWRLRRLTTYLNAIDAHNELKNLARERKDVESDLSRAYCDVVVKRTWLKLAENASPSIRAALQSYLKAIQKIGKDKGKGKRAVRYRDDARMAASHANPAVPCWIMDHYRVSESLPPELGCFDLVIVDEASQSDLTALPALLRAKKVLIVGDDKQVSPEGVGLEEEKIRSLMNRFLGNQVATYRSQMSPDRSMYDLFQVVFAKSSVMLKEHFRCVAPIIEYSKREFYNHELRPLRMPKASERLDPPLIDIVVEDGFRKGDVNLPEARFIVDEIKAIVADPNMKGRSIGVVSLLANKQALLIWERLTDELGPEIMQRHQITCGDARTFQGKERDIMFLSMVSAPNDVGAPLSRNTFAQRFNVAASRARDRMYLVRSVEPEDLSNADLLRRNLIKHFAAPFAQDEVRTEELRKLCESPFEREMYDELTKRGYWVTPQVRAGQYRIDLVVEGHNDARLALECDGDIWHGPDKWADDYQRQRILERAGWVFWRCFATAFTLRRNDILDDLIKTLTEHGIEPIGAQGAPRSVHTEHRVTSVGNVAKPHGNIMSVNSTEETHESMHPATSFQGNSVISDVPPVEARLPPSTNDKELLSGARSQGSSIGMNNFKLPFSEYTEYSGPVGNDPRSVNVDIVSEGIIRIIEIEGPVLAKRVYDIYLRGCGIKRMGHELKSSMNKSLAGAIRLGRVVSEDEADKGGLLYSVVRVKGSPLIRLRSRGSRSFEEIPPSELQVLAKYLLREHGCVSGSEEHLRMVLECLDLKRLTVHVGTKFQEMLESNYSYVDEFLRGMKQ